jgi:hypothetical protein
MDHDQHDDGLVHSHGWATEPPPSVGMLLRPANDDRPAQPANDVARAMAAKQDEGHDDGLVHGHDWASQHSSRRFHG